MYIYAHIRINTKIFCTPFLINVIVNINLYMDTSNFHKRSLAPIKQEENKIYLIKTRHRHAEYLKTYGFNVGLCFIRA